MSLRCPNPSLMFCQRIVSPLNGLLGSFKRYRGRYKAGLELRYLSPCTIVVSLTLEHFLGVLIINKSLLFCGPCWGSTVGHARVNLSMYLLGMPPAGFPCGGVAGEELHG